MSLNEPIFCIGAGGRENVKLDTFDDLDENGLRRYGHIIRLECYLTGVHDHSVSSSETGIGVFLPMYDMDSVYK